MTKEKALQIMATTKSTYQLVGKEFSDTRDRVWPEMQELVKKYVQAGDRVLDVGCGNGRLIKILPEVDYLGVDSSEVLLGKNKSKTRKLDILELDKLDQEFDIVFCFASFNHVASKELRLKVLGDIKKLLKPDGLLIMTNWNMWQWGAKKSIWKSKPSTRGMLVGSLEPQKSIYFLISEIVKGLFLVLGKKIGFKDVMTVWQSGDGQKKGEMYYRAFTVGELTRLLEKSGFKILENYLSSNKRNIVSVGRN